jgi:hypothetical protein
MVLQALLGLNLNENCQSLDLSEIEEGEILEDGEISEDRPHNEAERSVCIAIIVNHQISEIQWLDRQVPTTPRLVN